MIFTFFGCVWLLLIATCAYVLYIIVYRLWLCPVARFPGPWLAKVSFAYEGWYDVILKGRYTWKIKELHEKYGPIIRINPEELHINDPSFYDQIYVGPSRQTAKWHWSAKMFGTTNAAVGTIDHELHRLRRSALNPFFSKQATTRLEPVIKANVDHLYRRLQEFAGTGKPVNLSDAFTCLSADVIGAYAFGKEYGFLDSKDFFPRWRLLMMDLSRSTHLMKQFGWLYKLAMLIPEWLVSLIHPLTKDLFELRRSISDKVQASFTNEEKEAPHHSIFLGLSQSNLPAQELRVERLTDEGLTLIGAGTVTTAHTLAVIFYYGLSNRTILKHLRDELASLSADYTWSSLSQLKYLSAVVSEGLRLSFGVSHRLQRISPDVPLQYHEWTIPRGTPVSMTNMFIHQEPRIFPDPLTFRPERWLDDSNSLNSQFPSPHEARRYLVPFSRGTRACLGMNLAYAELFLVLGTVFKPVEIGGIDMELFETDYTDVECVHDYFNAAARPDSLGVRAIVR